MKTKRNRLETRKIELYAPKIPILNLGYIYDQEWRQKIKVVIKLNKSVQHYKYGRLMKVTKETSYFISTTGKYRAKEFLHLIRGHWGIENSNHYVRDETLREDRSQIKKKPEVMIRLKSFALNLMRNQGVENIAAEIHKNTLDMERMTRSYFSVE